MNVWIYFTQAALKNLDASAGDTGDMRDVGSITVSGRYMEKKMATHSSRLAWEIPWAENPGRLSSWGGKDLDD